MFRRSKKGKDEKKDKKDKKGGSSPTSSPSSSASPPASSSSASPHPTAIAAYTSPTGEEFDDKRVSLPRRVKPGAKTALPDPSPASPPAGRVSTSSVNEAMLDDILKQFGSPAPAAAAPQRASISSAAPPQRHSEAQEDDPLAALLAMGGVNVDFGSPAGGIQPQRGTIVSVGGGYNAPPPATAPSFPQMSGFPQQPMQATYSGELELELRHEMMNLRRNPRFYAQILINEFRPFYQGTALRVPGQPGMATREGAVACDDAIRFLSSVAPMQDPIFLNFGMCLAAKEAVDECCPTGSFEYPDSVTKMMNYGYLEDEAKDLVGYGGKNVRHMILLAFIICDGDPSRERRRIIFDPRWRMMGVGAGEHNSPFKIMGVVNFAIAYTPLLDGMKNSPMFRNLVQVDLKEDAREAGPVAAQPEEDDWRARLRAAALKVSQATGGMMLTDKREDSFIKAVDVFKQLKAVEADIVCRSSAAHNKNVSGPGDDDTQAKLRQAALLVGKATEHLVVSNANDQQYIRPVDIFKDLQAVSNAPVEFDPLRAKLSNAALGAARSTEQLIAHTSPETQRGGYQ
ncbi:Allergen V5/Tpx1 family protein [Acanthamoeba castellanii str. Neff]|uniref:Allergen V5/Tpx1 family protein n=1 Tax=Acanthamoeba castellanii (strain ATCC 30010 / Neff) TaxID=1257118 RepID=L8H123_ACACF|nr:Allergen V5/Tpx1 family protein [Acanthamoeba castellanii str. Neff]ELR18468.1 Allergen V5/Tpx1 family protein [Acanthamoeba castellanii str. Neff]